MSTRWGEAVGYRRCAARRLQRGTGGGGSDGWQGEYAAWAGVGAVLRGVRSAVGEGRAGGAQSRADAVLRDGWADRRCSDAAGRHGEHTTGAGVGGVVRSIARCRGWGWVQTRCCAMLGAEDGLAALLGEGTGADAVLRSVGSVSGGSTEKIYEKCKVCRPLSCPRRATLLSPCRRWCRSGSLRYDEHHSSLVC